MAKSAQKVCVGLRRCGVEEPDNRHRRLLRTDSEWPRSDRTAKHTEKFAPLHLSARAS
jgi:hypothetical protein